MLNLINENEKKYGREIRAKYGDDIINRSNAKLANANPIEIEKLSNELNEMLKSAFEENNPSSEKAQKACELHKKWLCYFWDDYTKEAHINIAQMYIDDPRFTAYYDKIKPGCAVFLKDAIKIFCKK